MSTTSCSRLMRNAVDFLDDDFRARHSELCSLRGASFRSARTDAVAAAGHLNLSAPRFPRRATRRCAALRAAAFADLAAGQNCRRSNLLPANGELLTWNVMLIVGSSTVRTGRPRGRRESRSCRRCRVLDARYYAMSPACASGTSCAQAHEAEHLQHAALALLPFAVDDSDHVRPHLAALDAADADQSDVT